MTQIISATFSDPEQAERAAGAILDHGIRSEHISVILPEGYISRKAHGDPDYAEDKAEHGITTTTARDAESGAAKGAGWGLAAGALAALAAVFVPGVGLVVGGGALAMALGGAAGATAAGAIAGGVTGYLKDQGVSDDIVEHYQKVLGAGGAALTVTPSDENVDSNTIEQILAKYNGNLIPQSTGSRYLI
jgi:uncharacterized membrane protein